MPAQALPPLQEPSLPEEEVDSPEETGGEGYGEPDLSDAERMMESGFPSHPEAQQMIESSFPSQEGGEATQDPGSVPTQNPSELPPDSQSQSNRLAPGSPNESSFFKYGANAIQPRGNTMPAAAGSLRSNPANAKADGIAGSKKPVDDAKKKAEQKNETTAALKAGTDIAKTAVTSGGNLAAIGSTALKQAVANRKILLKKAWTLLPPQVKLIILLVIVVLAVLLAFIVSYTPRLLGAPIINKDGQGGSTLIQSNGDVDLAGCTKIDIEKFTGYQPVASQGGSLDVAGQPIHTIEEYMAGKADYVSIATDDPRYTPGHTAANRKKNYGRKVTIPSIEADKTLDPKGTPIEFRIVDAGAGVVSNSNSSLSHFDIAVTSSANAHSATLNNAVGTPVPVYLDCKAVTLDGSVHAVKPNVPVVAMGTETDCGITSDLMIALYYNPAFKSDYLIRSGTNYTANKNLAAPSLVGFLNSNAGGGWTVIKQGQYDSDKLTAIIKASLDGNDPLLAYTAGVLSYGEHIVDVVGYDSSTFYVNNPRPGGVSHAYTNKDINGNPLTFAAFLGGLKYPDSTNALIVKSKYVR